MMHWSHWRIRLATFMLITTLGPTLGLTLTATPAFAQDEPPPMPGEEKKEGRTLDGYLLAGCLAGAAMFVVGKTARRL
jgi:hypothetical protein